MAEKMYNAEVMTEEQLDQVAGGTQAEFKQLQDKLESYGQGKLDKSQIETFLKEKFNIKAKIDIGELFIDGSANTYLETIKLDDGVIMTTDFTHQQVLQKIDDWGKAHKQ